MFEIGNFQLLILAVLAVLLFGNRLPEIMRSIGKGVAQFRRGLNEIQKRGEDRDEQDKK